MSDLSNEVEQFHAFATLRTQVGDVESLQELLDLWHAEQPSTTAPSTGGIASLKRERATTGIGPADRVIEGLHREIANEA